MPKLIDILDLESDCLITTPYVAESIVTLRGIEDALKDFTKAARHQDGQLIDIHFPLTFLYSIL